MKKIYVIVEYKKYLIGEVETRLFQNPLKKFFEEYKNGKWDINGTMVKIEELKSYKVIAE